MNEWMNWSLIDEYKIDLPLDILCLYSELIFRFGRDYYVRNAAKSAGTRKTPSISNESEVSLETNLNELEGNFLYHSLSRRLYSPRNSSRNFVKNPLLNFTDNFNRL